MDNLTPDNPGFISREVIIEIVRVLERGYNFTRTRVTEVVMNLATSDSLLVEDSGDVVGAAYCYVEGHANISDIMILSAAQRSGATPLYTFDRKLARFADAKKLAI